MARETRRMALYEAIRKGQSKRRGRKDTVRFRPFASVRRASATRKKEVGYYQRIEDGKGSARSKLAALWSQRVNLASRPFPYHHAERVTERQSDVKRYFSKSYLSSFLSSI